MKVAVVDYGMGNLRSVSKAIEHVAPAATVLVTSDPKTVASSDRVVFPGQGAMRDCMREMDDRGLRDSVLAAARTKPFLGICIGLQMLFQSSEEGETRGLGIFSGRVTRFPEGRMVAEDGSRLKVPHMGWNRVAQTVNHPIWNEIESETRFYFVHSYCAPGDTPEIVAGRTEYGICFTSAVARDNIFAVQFHPEKSHIAGLRLLANFIEWIP